MSEWINVNNQMPTGQDRLLVYEVPGDPDYTEMCIGYFNRLTGSWLVNGEDMGRDLAVTHWMPLPAPPPATPTGKKEDAE